VQNRNIHFSVCKKLAKNCCLDLSPIQELRTNFPQTRLKWYFASKIGLTYCSSDREKLAKFLRSLEQLIKKVKGQTIHTDNSYRQDPNLGEDKGGLLGPKKDKYKVCSLLDKAQPNFGSTAAFSCQFCQALRYQNRSKG